VNVCVFAQSDACFKGVCSRVSALYRNAQRETQAHTCTHVSEY